MKKILPIILSVFMLLSLSACSGGNEISVSSSSEGVSDFASAFSQQINESSLTADENAVKNVSNEHLPENIQIFKFSQTGKTYLFYDGSVYLLCEGSPGLISARLCDVDGDKSSELVYSARESSTEEELYEVFYFDFERLESALIYTNQSSDVAVFTDCEDESGVLTDTESEPSFIKVYGVKVNREDSVTDFTYTSKKLLGTISASDGKPDFKKHSGSVFE